MFSISYFLQLRDLAVFVVLFKRAVGLFREVFLAPLLHALNDNFGFCNGIQQIFITGYWVSGSELSAPEVMKIDDSCSFRYLSSHSYDNIFEHLLLNSYWQVLSGSFMSIKTIFCSQ